MSASRKQHLTEQRAHKRGAKQKAKAEARRSYSKEVPRGDRERSNAPINLWAGKLSSLFDVKPKGKAA